MTEQEMFNLDEQQFYVDRQDEVISASHNK